MAPENGSIRRPANHHRSRHPHPPAGDDYMVLGDGDVRQLYAAAVSQTFGQLYLAGGCVHIGALTAFSPGRAASRLVWRRKKMAKFSPRLSFIPPLFGFAVLLLYLVLRCSALCRHP